MDRVIEKDHPEISRKLNDCFSFGFIYEPIHHEQQRMMMLVENRMEVEYLLEKNESENIELLDFLP